VCDTFSAGNQIVSIWCLPTAFGPLDPSRAYSASTSLMPASTLRSDCAGNRPTFSFSICFPKVISCDTLTTESCGRPLTRRVMRTLPGASARRMFDVIAAQIEVRIALSLNSLPALQINHSFENFIRKIAGFPKDY
jgi:hypothetical protein